MSELQNADHNKKKENAALKFLVFESSCDDTSVAVLGADPQDEVPKLLSLAVQSQDEVHEKYGGVVPELASRSHLQNLLPCLKKVLKEAEVGWSDLDFFAATSQPGLLGSLLVGHTAAKTLSLLFNRPFISCHHLESHLLSVCLENELTFPNLCLLVSGGHSSLYRMESLDQTQRLGQTRDDAAGEAFDKGAKMLGLGFPGGPALERLAQSVQREAPAFPEVSVEGFDFSFSGLKSELSRRVRDSSMDRAGLARSYQKAIVDHLISKTTRALREGRDFASMSLVGGVARNQYLRERVSQLASEFQIKDVLIPSMRLCTDNAAMVGVQAFRKWKRGDFSSLEEDAISTSRPKIKRSRRAS